jgi:hypothetical protein
VEFRAMGWKTPAKAFTAQVTEQKWPEAPNEIFRQCADMVQNDPQLRGVWYFFEPDNVPVKKGWLDMLADQYNTDLSKPFLGYVDTTWERMLNSGQLNKIGEHMVGTGIFPPNLADFTTAHRTCSNAFDLAMAREIITLCRHTKLIHNNWRSRNYRLENGVIKSDVLGLREQQFGDAINRDVSPEAIVIHGCKDLSLLNLVKAMHEPKQEPTEEPLETSTEIAKDTGIAVSGRLKITTLSQVEQLQLLCGQNVSEVVTTPKPADVLTQNPEKRQTRNKGVRAKMKRGWKQPTP